MGYVDWNKIRSYDADVTFVVSDDRGKGKTYGLRKCLMDDYLKRGDRFGVLVRAKANLQDVANGYFDKLQLNGLYQDKVFRYTSREIQIADKPKNEGDKPKDWRVCGYLHALTAYQSAKERTFVNVKNVVLDEAIIEFDDRYHTYLTNEYYAFKSIFSSMTRENAQQSRKPHAYLLANACDLINPYFAHWGIDDEPKRGFSWHRDATTDERNMILYYVPRDDDSAAAETETVSGRMGGSNVGNFAGNTRAFIARRKPKNAKIECMIAYKNTIYSVWADWNEGKYYIWDKVVPGAVTYSLTASDHAPNRLGIKLAKKPMQSLLELYSLGLVYFKNQTVKEGFLKALSLFGIKVR